MKLIINTFFLSLFAFSFYFHCQIWNGALYFDWVNVHMQSILEDDPVGMQRGLLELSLFSVFLFLWQRGIFCYHQPFSIPPLRVLCCNLNLHFYLLLWELIFIMAFTLCSKRRLRVDEFFLCSFLFFCFFCNVGRWSLDKPCSSVSVVIVWGICSVVLGKPLSVFSGSCLHNPVHTPILSLYRKKKYS